jgi:hypothetical protein
LTNYSKGPIYFPDYKMQRTGKEKTPAYVIVGRPKESGNLRLNKIKTKNVFKWLIQN